MSCRVVVWCGVVDIAVIVGIFFVKRIIASFGVFRDLVYIRDWKDDRKSAFT